MYTLDNLVDAHLPDDQSIRFKPLEHLGIYTMLLTSCLCLPFFKYWNRMDTAFTVVPLSLLMLTKDTKQARKESTMCGRHYSGKAYRFSATLKNIFCIIRLR